MLTVTAKRTVRKPEFQILTQEVTLWGYSRLTPYTARAALKIAFGQPYGGEVFGDTYGYRVYPKSTRRFALNSGVKQNATPVSPRASGVTIEVYSKGLAGSALTQSEKEMITNAVHNAGFATGGWDGNKVFIVGAYYGEAIAAINALGYRTDDDDPEEEVGAPAEYPVEVVEA